MKHLHFLTAILIGMSCLIFAACSDDDEPKNDPNIIQTLATGVWEGSGETFIFETDMTGRIIGYGDTEYFYYETVGYTVYIHIEYGEEDSELITGQLRDKTLIFNNELVLNWKAGLDPSYDEREEVWHP